MNHKIYIIVATDENLGIGKNGVMPWNIKGEMKHFTETTTKTTDPKKQNMMVMGRTTWYSIPENHRPLKNRKNVVLTQQKELTQEGVKFCGSFDEAFALADDSVESIFIMGGASIYKQAVEKRLADGIFITRINKEYECDTYFPEIPAEYGEPATIGGGEEDDVSYTFLFYSKK
jgi:dihydrofolate reductase